MTQYYWTRVRTWTGLRLLNQVLRRRSGQGQTRVSESFNKHVILASVSGNAFKINHIPKENRRIGQNGVSSESQPPPSSSELPRLPNGRTKSQASTASSTRDSGISLSDHNRDGKRFIQL